MTSPLALASVASWNARALLHHKPRLRAEKLCFLASFAMKTSITDLQEVHGTEASFRTAAPLICQAFHVFCSFSENAAEAGVITLLRKSTSDSGIFVQDGVIPGRVLRVQAWSSESESSLIHWNIHNHDRSGADSIRVKKQIQTDIDAAKARPTCCVVIVSGDFNFLHPCEFRRSVAAPNSTRIDDHSRAVGCYVPAFAGPAC